MSWDRETHVKGAGARHSCSQLDPRTLVGTTFVDTTLRMDPRTSTSFARARTLSQTQWVKGAATHICGACKAAFKGVQRRHHYRRCGQVFCASCSSKKRTLLPKDRPSSHGPPEKSRVCDVCHGVAPRTSVRHPPTSIMTRDS